jgi:hypothetical protein
MRRLVFAPLISVLMLGAALTAAGAAGRPAVPEHPRGEPAAATVDPTTAPSVADLPVVAAGPTVADIGIARASATTPAPAVDGTVPLVKPAADAAGTDAADVAATDRPLRTMRLGCTRFESDATGLAVGCRWSAVDVDTLRGYQLWRVVDAPGTRRLIATVPASSSSEGGVMSDRAAPPACGTARAPGGVAREFTVASGPGRGSGIGTSAPAPVAGNIAPAISRAGRIRIVSGSVTDLLIHRHLRHGVRALT